MNTHQSRLRRMEQAVQPPTPPLAQTRLSLNAAWREQSVLVIVETLSEGAWHQGHHTDTWRGERGERELWPVLQDKMTWREKCELLRLLEDCAIVESRAIASHAGTDIFREYRLMEACRCELNRG